MIRHLLVGTLLLTAGAAQAASGPRVVDEAQSRSIVYETPSLNIVGSAVATVSGSPGQTQYETRRVLTTQRPNPMYVYGVNQPWQLGVESHS